jgi:pimeloyl-ACP methyl ester carboxylesterase/CRP-like cAMP-binding protein
VTIYNVNGQQLHVIEKGLHNRQVALLIHGWSSSWYALSPLLELLSLRFKCLAVDLPGYGKSPPLPGRTTIPAYADLLAELVAQVSDGPVVLVGHSMGGMTSVSLALRHPILVERMVLIGPTITGRLSSYINLVVSPITLLERFGLGRLLVSVGERSFVGITDRIMRPASFAERSGIMEADYERLRADARRPGQGRVRAQCYFAMRDNNLSGRLKGVEAPALVIWGAEDNTVPLRDAGVVADEWPDADLRILPKAGHWPQFEAPETTRRLVAAYLGLPRFSDRLHHPVDDGELLRIREMAQFLAHSDVGNNLNLAQRTRLAAQCEPRVYHPGQNIVRADETGSELYIIQAGTVEVWNDPEHPGQQAQNLRKVADLKPGQITGELAMLDGGLRSADLIAGPDGATLLALNREPLLALCEDDAVLGTRLLWNIATAMSQRVRLILWQLHRAARPAELEHPATTDRPAGRETRGRRGKRGERGGNHKPSPYDQAEEEPLRPVAPQQ